jgi:drug/metabolite transporter (DMT)-like permease
MSKLSWIGLVIVVAGIGFLVIADVFTDFGGVRGDQIVSLVAAMALLVVIGGGVFGAYWGRSTMALQHFAIWLAILAVIVLIYNYREALGFNFD